MSRGGGSYLETDPNELKRMVQDAEARTVNTEYEARVAEFLSSLLTQFNDRNTEVIAKHLEEIQKALEKELEGTVDLKFGGSVAKHTYIDGFSDVDALVILNNCALADGSPEEAREYFAKRLQERFPNTKVQAGKLAVTISFAGAEIQLLPAISCRSDVKISDATGSEWALIKPREFTEALTNTNARTGNKVVPVIKLAKGIIANLPEKHRISGYHAESLAVEIFRDYGGDMNLKAMLTHYFQRASELVRQPIRDRTGQSQHVDDRLGDPNSLERRIVSDAFGHISRRMKNADNANSVDEWRALLGE